jgi:hypothetical protein
MVRVRPHIRKGRAVRGYARGKPGKIVADKRSVRTVPMRDSRTGRLWGRRVI